MSAVKVPTGLLNYSVNVEAMQNVLNLHKGLVNLLYEYKPHSYNKNGFNSAYSKFITEKENIDMTKYGFYPERGVEDAFGHRNIYYKGQVSFFWSELFEAVHFGLVK